MADSLKGGVASAANQAIMEDDNLADPDSMLINFSDIPGSRARLERHAASARAQGDRALEAEFLTQIARCQGLQR
ncbi:MAG TPA: hypothetical protein PLA85_04550, partial [Micropepsaceae bacterium]|nr:hypothetical protein [Micropepsaceae bacterium]